MATTRARLHQGILLRLNELVGGEAGSLQPLAGGAATIPQTAVFDIYIDQANARLFRSCLLLPGYATVAAPASARTVFLESMTARMDYSTATTGAKAWYVERTDYGSSQLSRTDQQALQRRYPSYHSTYGTPTHYYSDGRENVGIYPVPAYTATVTVRGYLLPPPITLQETATYLYEDTTPLVEDRAAILVAENEFNDPSLYGRIKHLKERCLMQESDRYYKLPESIRASLGLPPPT
jgi:hypothetical protein